MTVSPRCRPSKPQLRPLERRRLQDESPEALLLSLGVEIRRLSGERTYIKELQLMEQIFVLLLEGFRPRPLPGGRVGLVPPQVEQGPGQEQQGPGQEQAIAALIVAGMDWLACEGQPAALCFPPAWSAA